MLETFLEHLGSERARVLSQVYQSALHIVVILVLAWVLLHLSNKGIRMLRIYLSEQAGDNMEEVKRIATLGRVFRYIASVVILLVTGMVILSELGISIAPILATAGVLGIAVGFGAQSLIKDYFNGFFMLLENQVRQGDVVEVAGKSGLVEEVTLRYIKMRNYEGQVHYIPNGCVTTVTNMSRDYSYSVIDIGVAYRENTDEVMKLMHQVGAEMRADGVWGEKLLEDMEMAGMDQWADSAVILRCRFKVKPLEQWGVRREYLHRLKRVFDQHGVEIPFPHLTLYPGQAKDGSTPALHIVAENSAAQ
ncbi:MAG: mechanosensitive ion channel family protein [Gallionellaceae bacterium]|nr:mechanosensitive ion channel family protein [Gallionellaceae bacterium]